MAVRNALGYLNRAGTTLSAMVMTLIRRTRVDPTLGARVSYAH